MPLRHALVDPSQGPLYSISTAAGPVLADTYPGLTAGQKIQAAVTALANTGGVVDCRGFDIAKPMLLDVDICGGLTVYNIKPFTFLWGPQRVRYTVRQGYRSHHYHVFQGTTFIAENASGQRVTGQYLFYHNASEAGIGGPGNGITTTPGSKTVTKTNPAEAKWGAVEVGTPLLVMGFVPPLGTDDTTINIGGGIGAGDVSITVVSTAAFPNSTYIRIENEIIFYTSKDATHFLGCTRGKEGTTAAAHANGVRVDRCVMQPCFVTAVSGNDLTLDTAMDITATELTVWPGALDFGFEGEGVLDGNQNPAVDDTANPNGIFNIGGRRGFVGPGLVFQNWDHGGWAFSAIQDCVLYGRGYFNTKPTLQLGASFWVFGWCKRNQVDILEATDCYEALAVDDRTTNAQLFDGPAEDSSFRVRIATNIGNTAGAGGVGLLMDGCRRCFGQIDYFKQVTGSTSAQAVAFGGAGQWGTETAAGRMPVNNTIVIGPTIGNGTQVDINVTAAGNDDNTIITTRRAPVGTVQPQNNLVTVPMRFGLTFPGGGAAVATDALRSEWMTLNVTDAVAFTISNPTNPTEGRRLTYYITNSVGGAMGAITWGGAFRLAGAFVNPANGQGRKISFRYHESNNTWTEDNRTPADQPI